MKGLGKEEVETSESSVDADGVDADGPHATRPKTRKWWQVYLIDRWLLPVEPAPDSLSVYTPGAIERRRRSR